MAAAILTFAFLAGAPARAAGPAETAGALEAAEPASSAILLVRSSEDSAPLPRPRPGAAVAADQVTLVRLPRPRPNPADLPAPKADLTAFYGFTPDYALKAALDAVSARRYADARALAADHADPLAPALIDWLIARETDSGLSAREIVALLNAHPDWPETQLLRLRAVQAFHALGPDDEAVLAFYSQTPPTTIGGKLALAGALKASGRKADALAIVRTLWREDTLSEGQAATVLSRFGADLRREDHVYRFRRLVLRGRSKDSLAQAKLIGPDRDKLARAVIAVVDRQSNAAKLVREVAPKFSADPLYIYARATLLLRSDAPIEAARLILRTKPDAVLPGDADVWWDLRRDLSRELLDRRTPDLAYRMVAAGAPAGEAERAEAAFHAGWYALRFLDKPEQAEAHFNDLLALATLPRTRARASYWLGRSFEAVGKAEPTRLAYQEAARFGGTFYGQLAREKIGLATTGLERRPAASALDRLRFAKRDGVRAIRLLAQAGHGDKAFPFFRQLAEAIDSPGEMALLTALARRIEQPRAGVGAASIAEQRGVRVASLPAPFIGVPAGLPLPDPVDRALVYAVVRQESAFNHQATSHVGARGLMQLMPATAKATALNAGLPFSIQRLTSDPFYNATLGAEHLGELLDRLNQSYVLTFVGYNAGPGRAAQWVKAYGDPRGGAVDVVDWIERIPFDETRNYVQRVMENLQVYRSRTGHPLSLSEDLIRGGPQG